MDKSNNTQHTKNTETNVLVIRLSAMGDVAMTIPVLRVFRATYPDVKLTVLTRKFFEPMFDGINNLEVFHAEVDGKHKGFLGLIKLFTELRRLKIYAVADLHNVLRSKVLKALFRCIGIKTVAIDKGRAEKKALTKSKNKTFKQLKTTHVRYAEIFEKMGYPVDMQHHKFPQKPPITDVINDLSVSSTSSGSNPGKKKLGIAPFAQYESKTYPLGLMEKVIEQLSKQNTYEIFLFGGGERENAILNAISSKYSNVVSVVGKLSFVEELKLIANLNGMVSMDSGNAHLAAMYGIPIVTLWGVTHPFAGFMPFGETMERAILPELEQYDQIPTSIYGNKVPEGYEKVMHTISPETVVKMVNKEV